MQLRCGSCDKVVETPEKWGGGPFNCSSCNCLIELPDAPVPEPCAAAPSAPQGVQEPTKSCPYCGETILKVARKCRHCKEDLTDGIVDPDQTRERLRAKEEALAKQLASGGPPAIPGSVGGRFRAKNIVGMVLTAGPGLLAVALIVFGTGDVPTLSIMPIVFAAIAGLCTLVGMVNDFKTPPANARTTPVAGMRAFVQSLRLGRFKYAYACLLGGERDGVSRTRKAMDTIKVNRGRFSFSSLAGFKNYWKGLARPGGGQSRRMIISSVSREKEEGDWALVRAEVRFETYPTAVIACVLLGVPGIILGGLLALALTKRESCSLLKLMRRVNGQWCVVNGEVDSGEDHAMNMALELSDRS